MGQVVTKPLTEAELLAKIDDINLKIAQLMVQKIKYLKDLRYYEDAEYRQQETVYKEKSLPAATEQANQNTCKIYQLQYSK